MAGLMNRDKGKAKPAPAAAADDGNVSPEEQAQYEEFVLNGVQILHDEKGLETMLQSIGGDGDPVEGLATTVSSIVMRLEDSAAQSGQQISSDVVMHGGVEIMEQAVELAEQAGLEISEKQMESALVVAFEMYRNTRQESGQLQGDPFAQDLAELQGMDDAALEQEFPGITEKANAMPQQPAPEPQSRGGLMRQG